MDTLLLDTALWDVCLDASGNIAVASNPYAVAQDVASAIKLFAGELYYDGTKGVPYFEQVLGKNPSASFIQAKLVEAALTVPDVVEARCVGLKLSNRGLSGTVEIIDRTGAAQNVSF